MVRNQFLPGFLSCLLLWAASGSIVCAAETQDKDKAPAKVEPPSEYQPKVNAEPIEPLPDEKEADLIKLDKSLDWLKSVEDKAPVRSADKNEDEHRAYNYILAHARRFSPEALARHSMQDVPFANLIEPIRKDYQFELIHFEGRAIRIDLMKPTESLAKTADVKNLYEVWLFPLERANESNPVCLIVSELPPDIKPGRNMNYWIGFDAYYFKLLAYESAQEISKGKNQWRVAPLFLGRTFHLMEVPPDDAFSFRGTFVPAVMTLLTVIGLAAAGIMLYFRRGDRLVREELEKARFEKNPFASGFISNES